MATPVATGLTRDDLDDLPDDGRRYELLDGRLFVTPQARRRHQWVASQIIHRLKAFTEEHTGTAYGPVNVDLAADTHLEPDVVYSTSEDLSGLGFQQAPELVVEVSSPSTREFDLGEKRARYAAAGTREFWFVDLQDDVILQFLRKEDAVSALSPAAEHSRGEQFTSPTLAGTTFDVDDLLGPPIDRGGRTAAAG